MVRCRSLMIVFALMVGALSCATAFAASKQSRGQGDAARLKPAYRFEREQVDLCPPGGLARRHRLSARLSAVARNRRRLQRRQVHGHPPHQARLGVLSARLPKTVLWPKIDPEYQQELQGIADGLKAHGVAMDVWDVVALNAMEEVPDYYVPWLDRQQKRADAPKLTAPGNCSAFVATGSMTKDHRPVIAHSNWTNFPVGSRWTIVFDIVPTHGYRIIQDGFPGIIVSDDDFGINSAGLMVTETTITGFSLFDPNGKPEFVRARKALQYASSIDEYVKIMLDGNNGGYANDWLLADNKTGEVARFELGLKVHRVWRTKDGYFVGSNFPSDPELIKTETDFNPTNMASSMNARHVRWDQLMDQYKGQIDVAHGAEVPRRPLGQLREERRPRRAHAVRARAELSARRAGVGRSALPSWWRGDFAGRRQHHGQEHELRCARAGYPCGADFLAEPFLKEHPEFDWEKPVLQDMKGNPWAEFKAGEKPAGAVAGGK